MSDLPESLFEVTDALADNSLEYGVTPTGFTLGSPPGWDDPGDGDEVGLPEFVQIYANGKYVGETTWNVFIMDLANSLGLDLHKAENYVYAHVLEHTSVCLADC